jgi:hypothetical protein
MTLAAPAECARTALTHAQIDFERFANPFCDKQREVKARGKHGPYCSAPCGMDGYALRRGRALLKKGRHHPFSPTADPLFLPRDLWQGCYYQAHHKASDADGHDCAKPITSARFVLGYQARLIRGAPVLRITVLVRRSRSRYPQCYSATKQGFASRG